MSEKLVQAALNDYQLITKVASDLVAEARQPGTSEARGQYLLGMAAYEMQRFELAQELLLESYGKAKTGDVAARLALCALRLGNAADADNWIEAGLSLDPGGVIEAHCIGVASSYRSIRAQVNLMRGAIDRALEESDAVLKGRPDDLLALTVRANALLAKGESRLALEAFDRALEKAPAFSARALGGQRKVVEALHRANVDSRPFISDLASVALRNAI